MSTDIDAASNFFPISCQVTGQRHYYGGCQHRISRIENDEDRNRWPDCAAALCKGNCKAKGMLDEEVALWSPTYYRDRDDCGPGIVKRAELGQPARSEREIADHHYMLKQQGLEPYKPVQLTPKQIEALARQRQISEAMSASVENSKAKRASSAKTAASPVPKREVDPFAGFDLGSMINNELDQVGA